MLPATHFLILHITALAPLRLRLYIASAHHAPTKPQTDSPAHSSMHAEIIKSAHPPLTHASIRPSMHAVHAVPHNTTHNTQHNPTSRPPTSGNKSVFFSKTMYNDEQ
ncbi:uncharacterized protein K452DRAFT_154327 [Aplosporella prunicola CBS 121167]|uniref:Secreted protein n=1 Tax=Aplosporella prunicola CBS 121167 TaxID=1176127 RepID=A0A6A6BLJ7_9PEZI|nr:uncharacterized protein K452DRAFT_154327 [Aplosporella prunicola CBS 121167]KAF2144175.1 hypothetical protein K452DRAFT_154327 [Aplosporella prunicola CBS 121167]